jgi:hypothetical protein
VLFRSVPGKPVYLHDGLRIATDLLPALETYPFLGRCMTDRLRVVVENRNGPIMRPDQPLSFEKRQFISRRMSVDFISTTGLLKEGV